MMRRVRSKWVWAAVPVILAILLGVLAYRPALLCPLPSPQAIRARALAPSSFILDRNGRVLYEIIDPDAGPHRPLNLEQVPAALREAVIATEDASFYRNPGVDLRAIARALWLNLRSGQIVSGGSTITQQVARNLLLEPERRAERSWGRKLHEALLAYHVTRVLSKDEILALYLNETYFGHMAYGVEAAARAYFDKPAAQLDLAECALLAGLPQAPSTYDPFADLEAAQARQRTVLGLMVRAGFIDLAQAEQAGAEPLQLRGSRLSIQAPHACLLVRDQASQILGEDQVRRGGLRIYTTLDLDLQRQAEAHVARHLQALNQPQGGLPGHNVRNAAAVALDPHSGAVRTLVGSPDYFDARIDGALNAAYALRQPGSALKPLTYAAAFERGYGPATIMLDVRSAFTTREGTPYVPQNYDRIYHGPVSLREALACSYNVVAVKLLDRIGIDALPDMAHRVGIESLSDQERQGLALTLGSAEVR
ncbi:MAG: transglycosylase domain-containing protein, partial [Anaerolineae bacterium]|nr:transglycosylase domain-containing protein [Anaerolineae bacterium]